MIELFLILIPAVLASLFMKLYWKEEITNTESLISLGANLMISLMLLGVLAIYQQSKMYDTEIWSGQVTGKARNVVSCGHSYSCNCYQSCSGSGKSRSCHQVCSTCYDHDYDVDWDVYTTLGTYDIDRKDRQGLKEPERWTVVNKGEYVTDTRSYKNPLLADEKTLFVELPEMKQANYYYPNYPSIFDYWKVDRILGVPGQLDIELSAYVNNRLKTMGPAKELNIILVSTSEASSTYFNGLMAHWRGGKKNDVILVYGIDKANKILWFKSNSYAMGMGNKEMHYRLLQNSTGSDLTLDHVKQQLDIVDKHYVRLNPEEIEFKAMAIDIPVWFMLILTLINLITSIAIGWYTKVNDVSLSSSGITARNKFSKFNRR